MRASLRMGIVVTILLPSISHALAQSVIAPQPYLLSVPKLVKNCPDALNSCAYTRARMMTTTFINNDKNPGPVHFVAILEIRDSTGVTVFLQFHNGDAPGRGARVEVASSWQPENEGEYELRTFVVSNFTNPEVLVYGVAPVNVTIN